MPVQLIKNVQQGTLTIYSEPRSCYVFVSGEYVGVTPIMITRDYGDYEVLVQMEGYEDSRETVSINSPDKTYTANLEELD